MPFALFMLMFAIIIVCAVWFFRALHDKSWIPPVVVATLSVLVISGILYADFDQTQTRNIVVEGKDRGGDDSSYRIYTDSDTLSVKDVWFDGEFRRTNSADFFGDILMCHRYEVILRGWESGFLSMMPNIVEANDLGPVEGCEPRS